MSIDIEQVIIQHSVKDVIRILENEPVQPDFIGQITAVQILNRISIAHLSIERAMKFLIQKAGGPLVRDHHLGKRLRELTEHRPKSAEFLRLAFVEAVKHYRYNPNAPEMKHLGSLESYFDLVGSDRAFQDLRYWELSQPMNDVVLRQIYLSLHMEILQAIHELLFMYDRLGTVVNRVERAVHNAMWPAGDLAYSLGTAKADSVHAYRKWLSGFSSHSEALAGAVRDNFEIGDQFMSHVTSNAYQVLLQDADPAVAYFAGSLDVLPRQPRDVIPCVKWLGEEKYQRGIVSTPSGVDLGMIARGLDRLWYITPFRPGPVAVAAKANSQKDARSYLATLLTREANVGVEGNERAVRLVASGSQFFVPNYDQLQRSDEGRSDEAIWTHKIVLWDSGSELEVSKRVRIRLPRDVNGLVHILVGVVLKIAGHEVYLSGAEGFDVESGEAG